MRHGINHVMQQTLDMREYADYDVEEAQRVFNEKQRERGRDILQMFMDEGMILDHRQPNFD